MGTVDLGLLSGDHTVLGRHRCRLARVVLFVVLLIVSGRDAVTKDLVQIGLDVVGVGIVLVVLAAALRPWTRLVLFVVALFVVALFVVALFVDVLTVEATVVVIKSIVVKSVVVDFLVVDFLVVDFLAGRFVAHRFLGHAASVAAGS